MYNDNPFWKIKKRILEARFGGNPYAAHDRIEGMREKDESDLEWLHDSLTPHQKRSQEKHKKALSNAIQAAHGAGHGHLVPKDWHEKIMSASSHAEIPDFPAEIENQVHDKHGVDSPEYKSVDTVLNAAEDYRNSHHEEHVPDDAPSEMKDMAKRLFRRR